MNLNQECELYWPLGWLSPAPNGTFFAGNGALTPNSYIFKILLWEVNTGIYAAINGEKWVLEGDTRRSNLPEILRNIRNRLLLLKTGVPATREHNLRDVVHVILRSDNTDWKSGKQANTWEWTTATGAVFAIHLQDRTLSLYAADGSNYLSSVTIEERSLAAAGGRASEIEHVTHQLRKLLTLPRLSI